ncbi:hypothetical protein ACFTZB_04535 [Rhodococcus sp. NPDC057014]|uniref:hypothetical protein n=1 Tax=Rhodococcus sp. NPDC057014 TaxID=3346000 RepID=UPI003637F1FD
MTAELTRVHLSEFSQLAMSSRESAYHFEEFRRNPSVLNLQWPDDVVEQWLYDHADNSRFLRDYGSVDLSQIRWDVEAISLEVFLTMPTGPSDGDYIDEIAANPDHWVQVRRHGVHVGVSQCWETHGTWKRWPVLIDRELLNPPGRGLQVIEGRTRVGILKGRHRNKSSVADRHLAWVGRAAT